MKTHERHSKSTSGQLDTFCDFRDDSYLGVHVAAARHQENILVAAGVQRQRDGHSRENHRIVQRNERKPCHSANDMHIVYIVNY